MWTFCTVLGCSNEPKRDFKLVLLQYMDDLCNLSIFATQAVRTITHF
jgi:hypothetical protein